MKKILFTFLFFMLILYSCFFPQITLEASKTGISIWFEQILPALLPFTILSGVLIKSNFLYGFSKNAHLIAVILTVVCGFVFGFPIGAKLSADFYRSGLLSEKQAYELAVMTNNFSPMYVCGYVLPTLFGNEQYQKVTYIILYVTPLIVVLLINLWDYAKNHSFQVIAKNRQTVLDTDFHLNMKTMDSSIISGFEALIRICGYIVLFSIIAAICCSFWKNPPFLWNWMLGNLEITNGIYLLSRSMINNDAMIYIAAIQMLSFGGLSGIAQTASIFGANQQKKLSIYKYIIGKVILSLFLTLLSVIYVYVFRNYSVPS